MEEEIINYLEEQKAYLECQYQDSAIKEEVAKLEKFIKFLKK